MSRKSVIGFWLLTLSLMVNAVFATESTFQVDDGSDDLFMTASGAIFKTTELITVMDPSIDVFVFLRFDPVSIPYSANINEAILSVRTYNNYDDSASGLDVTIYGLDEDDCPPFGDTADLNSREQTEKYKNWDISNLYGWGVYHNVTVTNIVQEIVIRHNWESGNALGFKILCDSEGFQRVFQAYEYGSSYAVKLYVTYNEAPPSPPPELPDDAEYVEDYRNYTIWRVPIYFNNTDTWLRVSGTSYKSFDWNTTQKVQITPDNPEYPEFAGLDNLVRVGKYIIYANNLNLFISEDEGLTWTDLGDIRTIAYPDLSGYSGRRLGMYVDRVHDPTRIWMSWANFNVSSNVYKGLYSYFEIADNGTLIFYPYEYYTNYQIECQDIHVDSTGRLWIAFEKYIYSGGQVDIIQLFTKFDNGTKTSIIDVTTQTPDIRTTRPQIAVNNETTEADVYAYISYQHYYYYATSEHRIKGRLCYYNLTLGGIENIAGATGYADAQPHTLVVNWVDDPDMLFLVYGQQTGASYHAVAMRYRSLYPGGGWSSVIYATSTSQQHYYPDCSLDFGNQMLIIIWRNTWNARTDKRVYDVSDLDWETSQSLFDTSNPLYVGCAKYFMENLNYYEYYATDENGTLVNEDPCLTVECIKDLIDEEDPDPHDPDPPDWEGHTISRFQLRLWMLVSGLVMLLGPVFYFSYQRPSGHAVVVGFLIMLIGIGFLIQVGQI